MSGLPKPLILIAALLLLNMPAPAAAADALEEPWQRGQVLAIWGDGSHLATALAFQGDHLLIGDPHAVPTDPQQDALGRVILLPWTGGGFTEGDDLIVPAGLSDHARFGTSVALHGDIAVVGSPDHHWHGGAPGQVHVFQQSPSGWPQRAILTASDGQPNDGFGTTVAFDGERILVGAPYHDGAEIDQGAVYVFVRSGGDWVEETKWSAPTTVEQGRFGDAIALDGHLAVVGMVGRADGDTLGTVRKAYTYSRLGSEWQPDVVALEAPDGDVNFGHRVALEEGKLVVAAPQPDPDGAGRVYVYHDLETPFGRWAHDATLEPSGTGDHYAFGQQVAISGARIAVGSPAHDQSGAAQGTTTIYKKIDGDWTWQADLGYAPEWGNAWTRSGLAMQQDVIIRGYTFNQYEANGGIVTFSVDGDLDNYTSELDGDCDDADPDVHPGRYEITDGVDTDCNGLIDDDPDDDADRYRRNSDADCDDMDRFIHPHAPERHNGLDDDCDGAIDENIDDDGDHYTIIEDGDCDDSDPNAHPNSNEVDNGRDDDCDGAIDEGFDQDGDGWTPGSGDCNDHDMEIHPVNVELDNGVDDDCDGLIDEGLDHDGDGYTEVYGGDCDDNDASIHPGNNELDNGVDDDCDGSVDEGLDKDGDSMTPISGGDCDDHDSAVHPGAQEADNGIDDDCDGTIDEGLDEDGDGVTPVFGGDCDDTDPAVRPGNNELDNGIDDDCDGTIDEDLDLDGDGFTPIFGVDCDDSDLDIFPGAEEVHNLRDDDCDGEVDEGWEDTDGDGLYDFEERDLYGTDPEDPDTDDDGLDDGKEIGTYHTDALDRDTDDDWYEDGVEVACGSDPNDGLDFVPLGCLVPTPQGPLLLTRTE